MHTKMFGEMLRELRLKKEITLRKFCRLTGLDPANVSRLERGIVPPPQSEETLDRIALILSLEEGTEGYDDFMACAAVSTGKIPRKTMEDDELIGKLPIFFRTLDGRKLTEEQLELLIEKVKGEL